jgi:hypothetical protein
LEISTEEFKKIRKELRYISDLHKINLPRGMLFTILTQKKVDQVKADHGKVIIRLGELADYWSKYKRIPRWIRLTPMMRVRLLLKALEFTKKEIKKSLDNPGEIEDEDLRRVVWKSVFTDYIYSPLAVRHQFARGKLGELILNSWLERRNISFKTEKEMRKESIKTPDFYFSDPIEIEGVEVNWIESKALFGDPRTHWIYWRKQYSKYLELFGDGFVVYWFGKVHDIDGNVRVWNEEYFRSPLMDALLDMRIFTAGGRGEKAVETLIKKFNVRTAVLLDTEIPEIEGVEIQKVEFDSVYSKEFLKSVTKIIDGTSRGRVMVFGKERDWRKCKRRQFSWVLRNMGFSVYHLR